MEKIVYLLGAGFSAPLGLPVMRDFLIKSKDLFYENPVKYAHFKDILDTIQKMHFAKGYYNTDLFNIEEILSILDMEDTVTGGDRTSLFTEYIKSIIIHFTPPIPKPSICTEKEGSCGLTQNSGSIIFGDEVNLLNGYGQFIANLLNLKFIIENYDIGGIRYERLLYTINDKSDIEYSIVTMNYDLVIENFIRYVIDNYKSVDPSIIHILKSLQLAKLHGSVDKNIVAPTWKKWSIGGLIDDWKLAYKLFSDATQIRILGYSLPISDSYIRYLLEASVLNSKNLKKIDVISRDDTGILSSC